MAMYPHVTQFETRMRELHAEAELARQVAALRPAQRRRPLLARLFGRTREDAHAPACIA
ncbi:MAG TPA: hypothetical protein VGJ25_00995 [Gaiellaceae bacterium]|jgi:hypothetical protein